MSVHAAIPFPKLTRDETKESIDAWLVKTKSFLRAVPDYKPYVDAKWIALKADDTRGFKDGLGVGDPPVVPLAEQATTKNAHYLNFFPHYAAKWDICILS